MAMKEQYRQTIQSTDHISSMMMSLAIQQIVEKTFSDQIDNCISYTYINRVVKVSNIVLDIIINLCGYVISACDTVKKCVSKYKFKHQFRKSVPSICFNIFNSFSSNENLSKMGKLGQKYLTNNTFRKYLGQPHTHNAPQIWSYQLS